MDYFAKSQFNHYNNIYHMECHESDPYSWEYEQSTQFDIAEAIQNVIVETTRYMDEYSELVRRAGEEQCTMLHQITETTVEAQDHFKGLTVKLFRM